MRNEGKHTAMKSRSKQLTNDVASTDSLQKADQKEVPTSRIIRGPGWLGLKEKFGT